MNLKNQIRKAGSTSNLNINLFQGDDAKLLEQEVISKGLVNLL